MRKLFIFCVLLCLWMFGCGGDNNTSGVLTLSDVTAKDLSGGRYEVDATATYVPVAGKEATNAVIDFTAVYTTPSNVAPVIVPSSYRLGTSGIASYTTLVNQTNEPIYLTLTASIGGLSQSKFVTIPLYDVTLRATPSIVSFIQVDPVGGQAPISVALSGGYLPYIIVSNDNPSDIGAELTGATSLTITKFVASGTNSVSSFATITLQDSKGTPATLRVNYFK